MEGENIMDLYIKREEVRLEFEDYELDIITEFREYLKEF